MPLQKLQFRPGVNREGTTLANEGGWFESDKVRFRSGYPEKIGGWVLDGGAQYQSTASLAPPSGAFWGVCRSMWNWYNLSNYNLLGLGTNLKYYIQNGVGGSFYDITPIRDTNVISTNNAFTTDGTTDIVEVNDPGHGAQVGDFVTISGVSGSVGGIPAQDLNKEFRVLTVIDNNTYTIQVATPSNSAVTTGNATFAYQLTTGSAIYTQGVGWGAGGWGGVTGAFAPTGWGDPAPQGTSVGIQLRLWSESNFGEDLIINPRGGDLYYWANNASPNTFDRAQIINPSVPINTKNGTITPDSACPTVCNFVLVSDASRFVVAFGTNEIGSSELDPLLIRWSDQESVGVWQPAATNQAGGYRLSHGSQIITAVQTRQEILVWTDAAVYSMQYQGPPYVWGFQIMGDNTSIASPNAAIAVNNVAYWMGTDKFYMYTGRVETLPCSLRQYVFQDINITQQNQFFCNTNEGYNEIWWYYCSANSDLIDRYVVYNHLERTWYYGTLARTSWLDSPLRPQPMATIYDPVAETGNLVYHESGNDDGTTNPPSPIVAYVQSSDFDIGDGHNFGFVYRIIPDVTFDGSTVNNPSLDFTVRPRQFPGTNYGSSDSPSVASTQNYTNVRTYNIQQFNPQVYVRIRGRQMAFRVQSTATGVAWQLGVPRIEVRPDGRR